MSETLCVTPRDAAILGAPIPSECPRRVIATEGGGFCAFLVWQAAEGEMSLNACAPSPGEALAKLESAICDLAGYSTLFEVPTNE